MLALPTTVWIWIMLWRQQKYDEASVKSDWDWALHLVNYLKRMCVEYRATLGENRRLVTDEPVEIEK